MADGTWTNQSITFNDTGTAAKPITLRAQTPGRVILNGTSKISIGGDYTVVDGLDFIDGTLASGNITASADLNQLVVELGRVIDWGDLRLAGGLAAVGMAHRIGWKAPA